MNSESIDKIHSQYLDCVNGTFSKSPMVEMVIPSMLDPTLCPKDSEHVVAQLFVMYSPNTLKDG
jgi:phytoene dehydrogenase-like protein